MQGHRDDINTVTYGQDTNGNMIITGSDDNLCKVVTQSLYHILICVSIIYTGDVSVMILKDVFRFGTGEYYQRVIGDLLVPLLATHMVSLMSHLRYIFSL